ncbi:MAG: hypothetical protein CMP12_01800 [Zunongwangia sp.]|nr:hypothetical protein [Zunongwangia sp.]
MASEDPPARPARCRRPTGGGRRTSHPGAGAGTVRAPTQADARVRGRNPAALAPPRADSLSCGTVTSENPLEDPAAPGDPRAVLDARAPTPPVHEFRLALGSRPVHRPEPRTRTEPA